MRAGSALEALFSNTRSGVKEIKIEDNPNTIAASTKIML